MTPEDRYLNDPTFHRLVYMLAEALETNRLAPGDLIDAAELAIRVARDRILARGRRDFLFIKRELDAAGTVEKLPMPIPRAPIEARILAGWNAAHQASEHHATDLRPPWVFRTRDHPQSNGRAPYAGDRAYRVDCVLEDGRALGLEFGELTARKLEILLLAAALADGGKADAEEDGRRGV